MNADIELILRIAQKHAMFSRLEMCCGAGDLCEIAILLEEIKRLNGIANALLKAVAQ